jgi:hypothetical protein
MLEPRGKSIELKCMGPSLGVLVEKFKDVVFISAHMLPLGNGLLSDFESDTLLGKNREERRFACGQIAF